MSSCPEDQAWSISGCLGRRHRAARDRQDFGESLVLSVGQRQTCQKGQLLDRTVSEFLQPLSAERILRHEGPSRGSYDNAGGQKELDSYPGRMISAWGYTTVAVKTEGSRGMTNHRERHRAASSKENEGILPLQLPRCLAHTFSYAHRSQVIDPCKMRRPRLHLPSRARGYHKHRTNIEATIPSTEELPSNERLPRFPRVPNLLHNSPRSKHLQYFVSSILHHHNLTTSNGVKETEKKRTHIRHPPPLHSP